MSGMSVDPFEIAIPERTLAELGERLAYARFDP